jgi:hypothetical protein
MDRGEVRLPGPEANAWHDGRMDLPAPHSAGRVLSTECRGFCRLVLYTERISSHCSRPILSAAHRCNRWPSDAMDRPWTEVIEDNPIAEGLDSFRASFRLITKSTSISETAGLNQLNPNGKYDDKT